MREAYEDGPPIAQAEWAAGEVSGGGR